MNLTDNSATALREATEATGLNKTDVINRSVQLYAWIETQLSRGAELRIVEPDGSIGKVYLI